MCLYKLIKHKAYFKHWLRTFQILVRSMLTSDQVRDPKDHKHIFTCIEENVPSSSH